MPGIWHLAAAFSAAAVLAGSEAKAASDAGIITEIDDMTRTVTFSDGAVYVATPTMDLSRLKPGYTIKVNFTKAADGTNRLTTLEIISPAQPSGY